MPKATVGPLNDTHYQEINRLLNQCEIARREAEVAKQARQPVDGHLQLILEQCDELTAIKKAYWPDRP